MSSLSFEQLLREYPVNRKRIEAMTEWELLRTTEHKGFQIRAYIAPEWENSPYECCAPEDVQAIRDGELEWFRVRVVAYKCDVPLGEDYLGGCCYRSRDDFLRDAYFTQMCDEAVRIAEDTLKQLAA